MQEEKLIFIDCDIIEQELYFIETRRGLLGKMSLDNGAVSYFSVMENYILKENAISELRTLGKKVYALKTDGNSVIIFDMEKMQCQYIPLPCAYRRWGNFTAFEQYGLEFYIFPRYENKIFIMNTFNNEIIEIADYFDGMTELQCACRDGDKIWLLPCHAMVIGCYDFTNGKMQIFELGKKLENCLSAVRVNGNIYILNSSGIIYAWNIDKLTLEEAKVLETEDSGQESMYGRMICAGGRLVVLPSLSDDIKLINLLDGSVEIYQDYPEDFLYYKNEQWGKYIGWCEDDSYYYFAMRLNNYLLKIDKQNGGMSWMKPILPSKEERMAIQGPLREKSMEAIFAAKSPYCVEQEGDIGRFLDRVSIKRVSSQSKGAGKVIFEKMKY